MRPLLISSGNMKRWGLALRIHTFYSRRGDSSGIHTEYVVRYPYASVTEYTWGQAKGSKARRFNSTGDKYFLLVSHEVINMIYTEEAF